MTSFALLLGRLILGVYFIKNGLNHFKRGKDMSQYAATKGVPSVMIPLTGMQLLAGGLSILAGFYPRYWALLLVLFLVPVAFLMHDFWNIKDPSMKMMNKINFDKNLALAAALLMLSTLTIWGSFSLHP